MRIPLVLAVATVAALAAAPGTAQQSQPADAAAAPQTAAEPAAKPAEEAAPQTAAEPAAKPAEEGAPQTAAPPAEKPAEGAPATAAAPAEKPAAELTVPQARAADAPLEFRTIVGDKPIDIADDKATPAFEQFRQTGENPFDGDEAALAEGKKLYAKLCQACHLPDGSGRIGPSLRDDQWRHPVLETPAGRFSIIHSGGAGAMQAFHPRMSIDEMLKVMAFIDTFRGG